MKHTSVQPYYHTKIIKGSASELESRVELLLDYVTDYTGMACIFDIDKTLIDPYTQLPILPIYRLLMLCVSKGITIFIITARIPQWRNLTESQLYVLGMRVYEELIMTPYKHDARKEIAKHYTILFSIGDRIDDVNSYCKYGFLIR